MVVQRRRNLLNPQSNPYDITGSTMFWTSNETLLVDGACCETQASREGEN